MVTDVFIAPAGSTAPSMGDKRDPLFVTIRMTKEEAIAMATELKLQIEVESARLDPRCIEIQVHGFGWVE